MASREHTARDDIIAGSAPHRDDSLIAEGGRTEHDAGDVDGPDASSAALLDAPKCWSEEATAIRLALYTEFANQTRRRNANGRDSDRRQSSVVFQRPTVSYLVDVNIMPLVLVAVAVSYTN